MSSSPILRLDREHRDPNSRVAFAHHCQHKRAYAHGALPGRAGSRHRSAGISLLLAFIFLLVTGGRLSISFAESVPASDARGSLVLFDFGDANDKQNRDAAIARFNKRYPNVKVTDQFTPISSWADYLDKLVIQIASG